MDTMTKALKGKTKPRKRYYFKDYSTPYLILYPLMIICWYYEKLHDKLKYCARWSDKRASRIIERYIASSTYKDEASITQYFREGEGWTFNWYWHCKWYHKNFCIKFNSRITKYMIEQYEHPAFNKEIIREPDGWLVVKFFAKGA